MSQRQFSLQFDEQSFATYMEIVDTVPLPKGALLRIAVEEWLKAGAPLDQLSRRTFKVDSSPDRMVTVAVEPPVFAQVAAIVAEQAVHRSDVLRCALRWYFAENDIELIFGAKPTDIRATINGLRNDGGNRTPLNSPHEAFSSFRPSRGGSPLPPRATTPFGGAVMHSEFEKIVAAVENLINDTIDRYGDLPMHDGYQSPALAATDALFSANAQYRSVENMMTRISPILDNWFGDGPAYRSFSIEALLDVFRWAEDNDKGLSSPEFLAKFFFQNHSRIGGRLKADALRDFCESMSTMHLRVAELPHPLNTAEDFEDVWLRPDAERIGSSVIAHLRQIRGIGPATPRYFLLLTGAPFIKPDVMVQRFVSDVLDRHVVIEELAPLLEPAILYVIRSNKLPYTVPRIDHLIWRFASGRPMMNG